MERTLVERCEEPLNAKEEIMAAWIESLEECGLSIYREPTMVSRRTLDFASIEEPEE